jgi:hypothetical protein
MSFADDRMEERRSAIENARARIAHGKHFPARDLAENITIVRNMLLKEYGTLEDAIDALDAVPENKPEAVSENKLEAVSGNKLEAVSREGLVIVARRFGTLLLAVALINPKALRQVARAFGQLAADRTEDPRAERIISAYEDCSSFPPTFTEVKRRFIDRFCESRWRGDFAVRKTLQSLNLPLHRSTRGRPPGSKNKI